MYDADRISEILRSSKERVAASRELTRNLTTALTGTQAALSKSFETLDASGALVEKSGYYNRARLRLRRVTGSGADRTGGRRESE
ncbi:MAG TPA: hypothetical protein VGS10_07920 [Terracidiphilus sp.]|nr:hypothetical protein [Terracidiphilus sp.]